MRASLAVVLAAGCGQGAPILLEPDGRAPEVDPALEARVDDVLEALSLDERVALLHGSSILPLDGLWPTADLPGLPGFRMTDGPRGPTAGVSTAFPVAMLRAATFDPVLEQEVGDVMGAEAAAFGANVLLAPVVNLATDPRYGRAQETYGEDPHLVGEMAVAFTRGVQGHVIATAKHFTANNIEDTRLEVDARIDPRTLREVFLPAFRRVVVEGEVGAVMSAYNKVNGDWASESAPLLRDVLKDGWGFTGVVMSDWLAGTHDAVRSIRGGLDIEMPVGQFYGDLGGLVDGGAVDPDLVEEAARRGVRTRLAFGLDNPTSPDPSVVKQPSHLALARRVAAEGMVLLKNDGLLPVSDGLEGVVVVGALADTPNIGDKGSSEVRAEGVITPLAGLDEAFGAGVVHLDADTVAPDEPDLADAPLVVVVVGFTWQDEGEKLGDTIGGDRATLGLSDRHQQLIRDVAAQNDHVLVVLEAGGAVAVSPWIDDVQGILHAFYPGQEGGAALAALVVGDEVPSGRMPQVTPEDASQLPTFDTSSLVVSYPRRHGQWHLDREGLVPTFPFGFGLSYTTFAYEDLEVSGDVGPDGEPVAITAWVRNTGEVEAAEVAQLYLAPDAAVRLDVPDRKLAGFAKVRVPPGERRQVTFEVDAHDLATWDPDLDGWRLDPSDWRVIVGPDAGTAALEAPLQVVPR